MKSKIIVALLLLTLALSGCEWPDLNAPKVSANTPLVINGDSVNIYFNATDNRGGNLSYQIIFDAVINVTGKFASGDSVNLTLALPNQEVLNLTIIVIDNSSNAAKENFLVYIVIPDQTSPIISEVDVRGNEGMYMPRARHFIVVFPFPCMNYHGSGSGNISYRYLDGSKVSAFSYIMAGCTNGVGSNFQMHVFAGNMTQEYIVAKYNYINASSGEMVYGEVLLG